VKSVPPSYPIAAETNGTEGWVELDFTVTESGGVKNVTVHAANPVGIFDRAAMAALAQWHYRPVIEDGKPVAQRARIRIRFALPR
jgi:periplasmic protein TonB